LKEISKINREIENINNQDKRQIIMGEKPYKMDAIIQI